MLEPKVSLPVGLAVAAVVFSIYSNATPTIAEMRHVEPNDQGIASARKGATWTAAGVVGGISLLTKDPTIFVVGGAMVVAMDFWTRHANLVNPLTGTATVRAAKEEAAEAGYLVTDAMESAGAADYAAA